MTPNDTITVGAPIPRLRAVVPAGELAVTVTWEDGRSDEIDLAPVILGFKLFRPLREDRALFESVRPGDFGSSIVWNDEMDLASYTLERLADSRRVMSTAEFREWMKRNHLTLDTAAPVLGLSRRTVAAISSGERPMDLTTTLACRGYEAILHRTAA